MPITVGMPKLVGQSCWDASRLAIGPHALMFKSWDAFELNVLCATNMLLQVLHYWT